MLDADSCYAALRARDPRFDGLFFVAVTTTGIYCRPICPARTPRADRCRFYGHAAAAEKAGFRACLRCRPELAPGRAPVDARPRLVAEALARIDAGALDGASVEDLASDLEVSARHLRRTLVDALGVGPLELAATRRLAAAKQLLHDSDLDLTSVAFASGFASVRRFNAAFRERFGRPPSAIRRELVGARGGASTPLRLRLDLRPPFDWSSLLAFLRARAIPGVERVEASCYRRLVAIDGHVGELRVEHDAARPRLHVALSPSLAPILATLVQRLRRLFDLDAEPTVIDSHLARDPMLRALVTRRPGLRVAGSFDVFEGLVRTVLGQQISVVAARTLGARLVERLGDRHVAEEVGLAGGEVDAASCALSRVFPSPAKIAATSIDALAAVGMPRARATLLRALAQAWAEGSLRFESCDAEGSLERLAALRGVGPWTCDYAALRVLHLPDAFPASDGALRRAFPAASSPAAIVARAEGWRPFRAYAAQHLWTGIEP
ncbi:AlkA N-terminal domain-containing protein [Pseudenhygromyxa sp. WMMC2535]|uniref:AlkA N-terminal domain-containing protein n=1 Tax=Pseudenhygromyxa sp. WMMC2535 TaxID=2712867 RepID=UPI0031F81976